MSEAKPRRMAGVAFFFQAEDGIRDFHVTGVQTCALPICGAPPSCWVFLQAGGRPGQDFPLTASCLQQVAWGRSKGRFYSSPKVGDLVLFEIGRASCREGV